MTLASFVIFAAGVAAGAINSIAGGGTLISFPALVWLGRDPIIANATNTVAMWPGSLAGAYGFRRELSTVRGWLLMLIVPSLLGGALGSWLLLRTPSSVFEQLVPATSSLRQPPTANRQPNSSASSSSSSWSAPTAATSAPAWASSCSPPSASSA